MPFLPAQIREMTVADTVLLVEGWNAAQQAASGEVPPMTAEQLADLKRMYPDG
jgi:hypothetical protein